ncbi:MAG: helix-turn-helix domain-containing protein [Bacteroidota bacterium]
MALNKKHIRLIFGLKLRQLRQEKGLSLSSLSAVSGLSISYLNEIEKGKKYPKTDKIIDLAQALEVGYDHLVSVKLSKKLGPIADLLNSGILDALPLEMFGLDTGRLLELISTAPTKINAFISSILAIARNHEIRKENYYFAALRAFQEMHDNYFEEIELAVEQFVQEFDLDIHPPITPEPLLDILFDCYRYTLDRHSLRQFPELERFRSVYLPDKHLLYINDSLSEGQQAFIMGKEIAFNYLKIKDRPYTSTLFKVRSFEEVLNNFRATYFSAALLLNRNLLTKELAGFFAQANWNPNAFLALMNGFYSTPETFLYRLSNILPKEFGLDQAYFLRVNESIEDGKPAYHLAKELHLSRQHNPHRNDLNEHYCRRWSSIKALKELKHRISLGAEELYYIMAQRSHYYGTPNQYLSISIARRSQLAPNTFASITIGIQIDDQAKDQIQFIESPDIPVQIVNETCERCPLEDCLDRVAPPKIVRQKQTQQVIEQKLRELRVPRVKEF